MIDVASGQVHCEPLEIGERAVAQCAFVGGTQDHARRLACLERLLPAGSAEAPPGLRPGKPNSGIGVERSLPLDLENARKAAVITAHTVWLPTSSGPVSQQPSRKKPVIGLIEQSSSSSPRTLRGSLRRPPPLPLSSLSILTSGGLLRLGGPSGGA